MTGCDEIGPLLGAFEDGELDPHEMQDVAHHLARCESCSGLIAEYAALGRGLRDQAPAPDLTGFAAAVIARIDRLPQPLWIRIRRWLGVDAPVVSLAWGGAVAAIAVVTTMVAGPYAEQMVRSSVPAATTAVARTEAAASDVVADASIQTSGAEAEALSDSEAVISRLESESSPVAVWSDPSSASAVIWLPDQP